VLQQAARGELEALFDAALRLEFGHFRPFSFATIYERPRQPIPAGQFLLLAGKRAHTRTPWQMQPVAVARNDYAWRTV
jgi:hypothetical protein